MIRNPDIHAGTFLVLVAALGTWLLRDLPFGTLQRMGPAFLPVVLCGAVFALGSLLILRGVATRPTFSAQLQVRPAALVLTAIVLFGLLIEQFGLIAATVGLVLVARPAMVGTGILESVLLALGLALLAGAIFVLALGLPIDLLPRPRFP